MFADTVTPYLFPISHGDSSVSHGDSSVSHGDNFITQPLILITRPLILFNWPGHHLYAKASLTKQIKTDKTK